MTLAWIRQAMDEPAGALEAIAEAGRASPGPGGLLNPVPAQRARLLLAQGDVAGSARWAKGSGLGADDEPDYSQEPGFLVLACPQGYVRVFADEGPPMAALLGRLIAAPRAGQAGDGIPFSCLARLQRAFDTQPAGPDPGPGRAGQA